MKADLVGRPLVVASLGLMIGISSVAHPFNLAFLVVLLATFWKQLVPSLWASLACLLGVFMAPFQPQPFPSAGSSPLAITGTVITPPTVSRNGETCMVNTGQHLYSVVVKGRRDLALGQQIHVFGLAYPLSGQYGVMARTEGAT